MIRDKYSLTSRRDNEGNITHTYSGRRNVNGNEFEPIMLSFGCFGDSVARKLEGINEDYLIKTNVEKITTKVVGRKIGQNVFSRLLNKLSWALED